MSNKQGLTYPTAHDPGQVGHVHVGKVFFLNKLIFNVKKLEFVQVKFFGYVKPW